MKGTGLAVAVVALWCCCSCALKWTKVVSAAMREIPVIKIVGFLFIIPLPAAALGRQLGYLWPPSIYLHTRKTNKKPIKEVCFSFKKPSGSTGSRKDCTIPTILGHCFQR